MFEDHITRTKSPFAKDSIQVELFKDRFTKAAAIVVVPGNGRTEEQVAHWYMHVGLCKFAKAKRLA